MYRIYINETSLILAETNPGTKDGYQELDNQSFIFKEFYQQAKEASISGDYLLLTPKPKALFKKIKRSFQIIKAAGGLVRNEENKYLFIFRKGKWDLPKGKIDPGEKAKKAAVREVEEECGISVDQLENRICKTWHIYELNGEEIMKKTSWYHMRANNQTKLIPQREEGITRVKWVAPGDFGKLSKNTYPLIRDVMGIAL
jgi:8-oxo-dGTP pyrophosphatase MutT (NUDIX family)